MGQRNRALMDRANGWLRENRIWKVTTCESVEFKAKNTKIDYNKMTYTEYGKEATYYVRGLRLWLTVQMNPNERVQQIGFLNMLPQQLQSGGIFGSPVFETLDVVVGKFNSLLRNNPIPGRVITIESQEMKVPDFDNFDADRSNWKSRKNYSNQNYLFVIRIFYEVMDASPDEIGFKDFIPDVTKKGGILFQPEYAPFSTVVARATEWCSQQYGLRFCNAQSVEIKMKPGKDVDTQKMNYTESSMAVTFYVKILRVAYTKTSAQHLMPDKSPLVKNLTCRIFEPLEVTSSSCIREYENLHATRERVMAWIRATGAQVLSAETTAVRSPWSAKHGVDNTFYNVSGQIDGDWMFIIRLYLNGAYREPPPEMLPPVPVVENPDCCCTIT